jgi:excisionase family DNA binding protein
VTYRCPTFRPSRDSESLVEGGVGFYIHFGVVFYNNRDLAKFRRPFLLRPEPLTAIPSIPIRCHLFPSSPARPLLAQGLRCTRNMEAIQSYPNLLSEKQAAKRLGVARITLLRARAAGRIRFFRVGTRVLYCAEHLTEFLERCERNRRKQGREAEGQAPRKENRVSSARGSVRDSDGARSQSKSGSRKKEQASLPFAASR